jgi:hypothetical protein
MINKYFIGVSLGQAQERTALAVVETQQEQYGCEPVCKVRHLKRYDIGTSFPDVIEDTINTAEGIIEQAKQKPALILEATGVGAPVVNLFHRERQKHGQTTGYRLKVDGMAAAMITAGDMESSEHQQHVRYYRLPKRNMASVVQVLLQTGCLKIAPQLAEMQTLLTELQNFKVKINTAASSDSFDPLREGEEDDLVFSVAVACWHALDYCKRVPVCIPQSVSFYDFSW